MSSAAIADTVWSVAQAAHYLGVTAKWLYERTPEKGGPPRIVYGPRTIRYYKRDLDAWRESRRNSG